MPALLVLDTKIRNPELYEEYKQLAKPIAEQYGGRYRFRGGDIDLIEDELWTPTRMVVIEFATTSEARAFVDSVEYAKVKPIRAANADSTSFIIELD